MQKGENKIKENVKKIAYFAIKANNIGNFWTFDHLEKELQMSKPEIIAFFDLFSKADLFHYELLPKDPGEEDFEIYPTKEMIENRTGCFNIFFNTKTRQKNLLMLQQLKESPNESSKFLKKYGKHLNLPTTSDEAEVYVGDLQFNTITGDFAYHNTKGNFNPKNQDYKMLCVLIKNSGHQVSYEEILKIVRPDLKNPQAKSNRDLLYTIVKKINIKLGILQNSKNPNPDFIESMNDFGYRLISK